MKQQSQQPSRPLSRRHTALRARQPTHTRVITHTFDARRARARAAATALRVAPRYLRGFILTRQHLATDSESERRASAEIGGMDGRA